MTHTCSFVFPTPGGFEEFGGRYPSLCRDQRASSGPSLTSLSQPCLPTGHQGPTRILPFLYLGSQQDAQNQELLRVSTAPACLSRAPLAAAFRTTARCSFVASPACANNAACTVYTCMRHPLGTEVETGRAGVLGRLLWRESPSHPTDATPFIVDSYVAPCCLAEKMK